VQQLPTYRIRVLQQQSIIRLDGFPISAFTRKQVAKLKHGADVDALANEAAKAYTDRMEAEKLRVKNHLIELQAKQRYYYYCM